jgi:aspartate carbamoyltransferase regulatory subunit
MDSRFVFDAPRVKIKTGPNLKSLLVRCPSTSKLTDTRLTVEEKLWPETKLKKQKFTCAHCGRVHSWTKTDVILGRPLVPRAS